MRLAVLACSTLLLSGCSWLGFGPDSATSWSQYNQGAQQASGRYHGPQGQAVHNTGQYQSPYQARSNSRCEIRNVSQPVPQGCRPEDVTIALPSSGYAHSGQSQAPAAGSYGHSVGDAGRAKAASSNGIHQTWQRPRLRLNASTGFETSVSGAAFNASGFTSLYDPTSQIGQTITGAPSTGQVVTTVYSAEDFTTTGKDVSFSDLYAAPFSLGGGAEYQLNDRMAVFANAGYTHAAGRNGGGQGVVGAARADISTQNWFTPTTTNPDGSVTPSGPPVVVGAPIVTAVRISDTLLASSQFEVSDLKRINLEVGGRYYFDDAFADHLRTPLNPYVAASAGAAHYDALSIKQEAERLILSQYMQSGGSTANYVSAGSTGSEDFIKKGWVPTGSLTVGAEWQMSPSAALALETGLRFEGKRDYVNSDAETGNNISVPLTLRGSIGF